MKTVTPIKRVVARKVDGKWKPTTKGVDDQPRTTGHEVFICTPDKPWLPAYGTPVRHTNVEEVGDQRDGWPGGDIQKYRCKDCGATWTAELPQ